ncbi:molecular chaperone HtpG [Croceifilum oryzae]|uniref:Molecular chaperone HtpG n=1 Tax=Croceifilum oryzae TaxID=1553429 RepID=A0AAJ1TIH4_9BACL|nr:HSP90 family protein [Croceifilum oryzae]MDQ0416599.1 molecular chaperone HtpG [Croceifilum oryzae]
MSQFHFKVNLKGMIDLLSNHLYSTPHVYLRELIQNGVDALTARKKVTAEHEGTIGIELFTSPTKPPTLYIEDNGIGLTEEEVHQFLSQIGQTSKRGEEEQDFIGRFGVGLLSCFIVSEEIVLITRSVHSDEVIEWRGKPDGSYQIKKLDQEMLPGTKVFLQSKRGFEEYFQPDSVRKYVKHYGEFLPYPIYFYGEERIRLNEEIAPWEMRTEAALQYAEARNGARHLDAIPLSSTIGGVKGIAYVLPYAVSTNAKQSHQVYVKQMLLSEKVSNILPDWAFFVTGVLNADGLRLTASREEFYQSDLLELVRVELGDCIKKYLVNLAEKQSDTFWEILDVHYSSIKSLAVEDDELYALFVDWLPFETSLGRKTMKEIRSEGDMILYTSSVDQFRQVSKVAKAQSVLLLNGGYVHDSELLRKLPNVFPELEIQEVDASTFSENFVDLTLKEREEAYTFLRVANLVLQPFQCECDVKKFNPSELPALYTNNKEASFFRNASYTKEETNDLFASIIDQMVVEGVKPTFAQLCFNYDNPTIQQLFHSDDPKLQRSVIETLYVQALLLGHHPLKQSEMKLLNKNLRQFISWRLEK